MSVAAIRLPRVSNTTDVEALACEPGVDVTWVDDPASVAAADLVVVPGTRATVDDLRWLTGRGIGAALVQRSAAGRPILGICGGFQMLGRRIQDGVESGGESGVGAVPGPVDGLGIFDVDVRFDEQKTVRRACGVVEGIRVAGYEIHHGVVTRSGEAPWLSDDDRGPEGAVRGAVRGTHWHGLLACDDFRRELLRRVGAESGSGYAPAAGVSFDAVRAAQVDAIADLVEAHLDMTAVGEIITRGTDPGLPTIVSGLRTPAV